MADLGNRTTGASGVAPAVLGVVSFFVAGLFFSQAGGSDRETFLALGYLFQACGFLGVIVGGVVIALRLSRG